MRKLIIISALFVASLLCAQESTTKQLSAASATTKVFYPTISYQGIIKDNAGKAIANGKHEVMFKIYDGEKAEKAAWSEKQTVNITDGIVNAQVGAVNLLNLPFDKQYWMSVVLDNEELPRTMLSAAPYSMFARRIDQDAIVGKNGVTVEKNKEGQLEIGGVSGNSASKGGWVTSGSTTSTTDNVGIGTTTPAEKLDINGNMQIQNQTPTLYLKDTGFTPTRPLIQASGNDQFLFASDDVSSGELPVEAFCFLSKVSGIRTRAADLRVFGSSSSENWMNYLSLSHDGTNGIISNGQVGGNVTINDNVGILTTNTYSGAALTVNGKIAAKEIVVSADVAGGIGGTKTKDSWPDYVFDSDYKMMSLDETAEFIKTNKHLPGVPSRDVVSVNGINVGDMQHILLKKVEELTLHLIELKKENADLRSKVNNK